MGKRSEAVRPPAIALYDGACGLCTRTMLRGKRYQRPGAIEWVDNGSEQGQALLRQRGLLGKEQDSIVVVEGARASLGSSAVVRLTLRLRWPWKSSAALWIVPKPLRDAAYRRVAANRAKHAECQLPPARPRA